MNRKTPANRLTNSSVSYGQWVNGKRAVRHAQQTSIVKPGMTALDRSGSTFANASGAALESS